VIKAARLAPGSQISASSGHFKFLLLQAILKMERVTAAACLAASSRVVHAAVARSPSAADNAAQGKPS
jgi:hypothetical protein